MGASSKSKSFRSGSIHRMRVQPTPSEVYPILWKFAQERQSVFLQRVAGCPPPWTDDRILREYKFTNAYRASDRVSQFFIQAMYASDGADEETIFLRTLLFKIFNKIETWQHITAAMGEPDARRFDFQKCDQILSDLASKREKIYSAAYIMPSGGVSGLKHRMHLSLLKQMLTEKVATRIARSSSLRDAYEILLSLPSLGPFLAFQYAIDLNYTELTNHSEMDFVVAGPGALDGLSKCFLDLGDYSPEDTIRWVCEMQDDEFRRLGLHFPGLWGRPLQLIDVQNLFCEVSKYTRVSHPHVPGKSGRTKIKQKFSARGALPAPFFPPKWGINQRIKDWTMERTRQQEACSDVRLQRELFSSGA